MIIVASTSVNICVSVYVYIYIYIAFKMLLKFLKFYKVEILLCNTFG